MLMNAPLSFWGGVDIESGKIIDRNHPQAGQTVTAKILVMPHGRGSSSSATVLAEMIRIGTAPVGLILSEPDQILVTAGFVANHLYGTKFVISVGDVPEYPIGNARLDGSGLSAVTA